MPGAVLGAGDTGVNKTKSLPWWNGGSHGSDREITSAKEQDPSRLQRPHRTTLRGGNTAEGMVDGIKTDLLSPGKGLSREGSCEGCLGARNVTLCGEASSRGNWKGRGWEVSGDLVQQVLEWREGAMR